MQSFEDPFQVFQTLHADKNGNKWVEVDAFQKMVHETRGYENHGRKRSRPPTDLLQTCPHCGDTLQPSETVCTSCASVIDISPLIMPTKDEMIYKYQTHQLPCAYKRINHFNEKLAQFQGREKTTIPEIVYVIIKEEVEKTSNLDIQKVSPNEIKYILKKRSLSKYYEHVNFITKHLNGYDLPSLSPSEEDRLRKMFLTIQAPFSRCAPKSRKNFLNYAYIFRKFFELLSFDSLLEHFSELKSREKLYEQDRIWECMCKELNWQYIPSI